LDLHVTIERGADRDSVRVAGRLASEGVRELARACEGKHRLRLDLSELVSADEEGTRLLCRLVDAGAELVGTPPYIDLLFRARAAQDLEAPRAAPPNGNPPPPRPCRRHP
jgi:hypothetical protein